MAIENFTVGTIDLTSRDEVTGLRNTANVYFVPGIGRELSIAELVIAVCLDRASDIEAQVVGIMEQMSDNTRQIEELLGIENYLVEKFPNGVDAFKVGNAWRWAHDFAALFRSDDPNTWSFGPGGPTIPEKWRAHPCAEAGGKWSWIDFLSTEYNVGLDCGAYFNILNDRINAHDGDGSWAYFSSDDMSNILSAIESRLDALNTTSQEVLIKLQSLTNKRDQTYDLITSMVKSTLTAGQSISANMR